MPYERGDAHGKSFLLVPRVSNAYSNRVDLALWLVCVYAE